MVDVPKDGRRKEDASADAMENENERKQIAWLEERIAQRDTKIDGLYAELRQSQSVHLDEVHKRHETELKLKEAEMKRCDVRGCGNESRQVITDAWKEGVSQQLPSAFKFDTT